MKSLFDAPASSRYISHRGFQPLAPANSLPGFVYAGFLHQWAIETDVRITKDGILVCCHDDIVDTTFDASGVIAEMTWKEIAGFQMNRGNRLDCLTGEQKRMPLFSEYLVICKHYGSIPFIELKTDDAERVIHAVHEAGFEDTEVVMSSISLERLVDTRRYTKEMFIHWIFAKEEQVEVLTGLGNAGLSWNIPDALACPQEKITLAHEAGLKVCLRAGDSIRTVQRMVELGLDYFPTNCMHMPIVEAGGRIK
ncbi:MAG: hypothetical protein IJZ34_04040 [Lachnospiraceae bacterium]|nr:hypothetical protein [Lachnospiraceae bacterium]